MVVQGGVFLEGAVVEGGRRVSGGGRKSVSGGGGDGCAAAAAFADGAGGGKGGRGLGGGDGRVVGEVGPGAATPTARLTGMMVTARVADFGRSSIGPRAKPSLSAPQAGKNSSPKAVLLDFE
jgi:hypothetical protein